MVQHASDGDTAMNLPSLPLGFIGNFAMRVYDATARAPCIIDIDEQSFQPHLRFRIRNASTLPIKIEDVDFEWQSAEAKDFDTYMTPMNWMLARDITPTIEPGHASPWFELDTTQIEGDPKKGRITVRHSRSGKPTTKRFDVPLTPKERRDLMRDL